MNTFPPVMNQTRHNINTPAARVSQAGDGWREFDLATIGGVEGHAEGSTPYVPQGGAAETVSQLIRCESKPSTAGGVISSRYQSRPGGCDSILEVGTPVGNLPKSEAVFPNMGIATDKSLPTLVCRGDSILSAWRNRTDAGQRVMPRKRRASPSSREDDTSKTQIAGANPAALTNFPVPVDARQIARESTNGPKSDGTLAAGNSI